MSDYGTNRRIRDEYSMLARNLQTPQIPQTRRRNVGFTPAENGRTVYPRDLTGTYHITNDR